MNHKNKTNQIAKNTLVLYFRMILLMLITLYTSRVILEALGVEDYGIYNVVGGFVSMFALVSSALTSACTRFLNYEMGKENPEKLSKTFSTAVTVQTALSIIVALLCESIGVWYVNNMMVLPEERLVAANWCLQFSVFSFCLNLLTVPYNAAIIAHERMKTFAYVSIFDGIAKLGICYLIMYPSMDKLVLYGLLMFVESTIIRVIYQIYCKRNFEECRYHFVIDKPLLLEMFTYAGWHLVGNSTAILKNQGVNMLLNLFYGPVVNASKGIATQVLHAVSAFASNFMMALNPQITQNYAKGDWNYCFNLVYKGSRFSFYILFLISLPIIVNTDYILHLWLKEVPEYAIIFVQLTLVVSIMGSLSNTLITLNNATGKVRNYQIVVGGIQMLNLPLSYFVLKLGVSPSSVMYIAIFCEILCLLARLYMIPRTIREFHPNDYFRDVLLKCLYVVGLSSVIPIVLDIYLPENKLTFILNIFASLCISTFVIYYVGCNRNERYMIIHHIKKIINKLLK